MPETSFRDVLHVGSPLLWLPLTAAVLFSMGAIILKRAGAWKIDSWRVTFISNQITAITFLPLLAFGGTDFPVHRSWQPLIVGGLFVAGRCRPFWH